MATYKLKGARFLRKYAAKTKTPTYAAAADAQLIVESLCDVPWELSTVNQGTMTSHNDKIEKDETISGLDRNAIERDNFDAALFCAGHSGGSHRAYANAACYRFTLPDGAIGTSLTSLAVRVTSDPYNAAGARLHIFTNSTGEIPANCHTLRGEDATGAVVEDGSTVSGAAPRATQTANGSTTWFANSQTVTVTPTGGLTLQKHLFLVVALESYSTVRGNWLEGCSYIQNSVSVTTSTAVTGWTDGDTVDCSTAPSEPEDVPFASAAYRFVRIPALISAADWRGLANTVKLQFTLRPIGRPAAQPGTLAPEVAAWSETVSPGLPFEGEIEPGVPVAAGNYILSCWQGDGDFTPGMLFGCTRLTIPASGDVEPAGIEIARSHPTFPRIDLAARVADRNLIYNNPAGTCYFEEPETEGAEPPVVSTVDHEVRIAIRRVKINNETGEGKTWNHISQDYSSSDEEPLFTRIFARGERPLLTEADFLAALPSGEGDFDWGGAQACFTENHRADDFMDIESASYAIYVQNAPFIGKAAFGFTPPNYETATTEENVAYYFGERVAIFTNRYEFGNYNTRATDFNVIPGRRPIFRWRMQGENNTDYFGKSYPAFRMAIWPDEGNGTSSSNATAAFDSGVLIAPPRDFEGFYAWTAPEDFSLPAGNWVWCAGLIDAKHTLPASWEFGTLTIS